MIKHINIFSKPSLIISKFKLEKYKRYIAWYMSQGQALYRYFHQSSHISNRQRFKITKLENKIKILEEKISMDNKPQEKGKITFENGSDLNMVSSIFDDLGFPLAPRKIPMPEIKPFRVEYDYIKNINHLIERYNNKQDTLHVKCSEYEEGLNDGLQTAIHDLEDMLNGLEV